MATAPGSVVPPSGRVHIVLVPGFAGFDALGQVEYYSGTTEVYRRWLSQAGSRGQAAALHYFDNLPTAGVSTRAARLRAYLAKRIARGEIKDEDKIALVGHSTGGLDIRRLLFADDRSLRELHLDGGDAIGKEPGATAIEVVQADILKKVKRVVFVSVPQYGTNIADWVRRHPLLRRVVIEDLQHAVEGSRVPPLEDVLSQLLDELAKLKLGNEPDLVLAARDALDETKASRVDPILRANAQEAASQLRLWLQHAVDDFGAIDDLASFTAAPANSPSPAHYPDDVREKERVVWADQGIDTMSIATVGRRAFKLKCGELASRFDLLEPGTWPTEDLVKDARQMDISYLVAYRACAGGAFNYPKRPLPLDELCRDITNFDTSFFDETKLGPAGPRSGAALETWDNDGIVNTASMLWPNGKETRLVAADHLDIVGHYALRQTIPSPDPSGRRYASYDALKSDTQFTQEEFAQVWKAVFEFCL